MKNFFSLLIVLISTFGLAQKSKDRKITIDDFKQNRHQIDTSATAAILHKKSKIKYVYDINNGFQLVQEVEYIYKIYKKEGLSYANVEVPYYTGYKEINQDRVKVLEAETYNLINGKIEKTEVKKESIFKSKINEFWDALKVSFPNIKEGSIFKFKYEFKSADIGELPDYHFQYDIPVDYVELSTFIPEFYIYKTTQTGLRTINLDSKFSSGSQNYEDKYKRSASFSYKQIDSFFYLENVPALREEPNVDLVENYRIVLFHELEVIRMPEQDIKKVAMTWEDVGLSIKNDNVFKDIFENRKYFENHIAVVLQDTHSKEDIIHKLFRNVQSTTNWNGKYGIYKTKMPLEVFNNKVGNISEINGLLIKMLREKEINAYPLLISTVNNGVAVFPTKRKFNAYITAVDIDGKILLMDASDKNSSIDILPSRNLNWFGQMIRHDHQVKQISLSPKIKSNKNINIQFEISNFNVSGKLRSAFTNHQAYQFLKANDKSSIESSADRIENQYSHFDIENFAVDKSEREQKYVVTETLDFKSDKCFDVISNKMMINPFLGLANVMNPFTQKERILPIYFGNPQQLRFQANIKIDNQFKVEFLPEPIHLKVEGDLLSFVYRISQNENSINASIVIDINQPFYNAQDYEDIKTFFNKMTLKMKEKIVLVNN